MTAFYMPSTPKLVDSEFHLETNTQVFTSRVTRAVKRQELDGARWMATFKLPSMNAQQGAAWKAFFWAMRGMVNTFYAWDPDHETPLGPAGGTPVVDGASQTGTSLNIRGCTPNQLFLAAGDNFAWTNGELKGVISDAVADGSGDVTLNFEPRIRTSPADGTAIITYRPSCNMILMDDSQGKFVRNANGIYLPKTFTAYEVFE